MAEVLRHRIAKGALIFGLSAVALTGCGSNGRGEAMQKCGDEATDIRATFPGDEHYKPSTDPGVLLAFSKDHTEYQLGDPSAKGIFSTEDVSDKVGEISCLQGEIPVLNTTGAQLQASYTYERNK